MKHPFSAVLIIPLLLTPLLLADISASFAAENPYSQNRRNLPKERIMADKLDVRNVRWGMSKKEVMEAEKDLVPTFVDEFRLIYEDVILWDQATIDYVFNEKQQLFDVLLTIQTDTAEKTYLTYMKLSEVMQNKYGPPLVIKSDGAEISFADKRTAILIIRNKDNVTVDYTEVSVNHRRIEEIPVPDGFQKISHEDSL